MAKTDFSSSSPLAGSFLTGLISRLPPWRTVAVGGAVYFILQQYGRRLSVRWFAPRCGFSAPAFFASVHGYDMGMNMGV